MNRLYCVKTLSEKGTNIFERLLCPKHFNTRYFSYHKCPPEYELSAPFYRIKK